MLPDVALLGIFDFYVDKAPIEAWQTLVHVCRTWRNVVFGSPRRLNLRLLCKARTPVREMLGIWPLLPIVIEVYGVDTGDNCNILDNVIPALKHNDRICKLVLFKIPGSETEKLLAALQQPFPELTDLQLVFSTETAPVVPASFLGGSAPALQSLCLELFSFPGLPNLLLSATHLVDLHLYQIPHSGYISPEAMVTALSALTSLKTLHIEPPRRFPDRRLPSRARVLLPVLTSLRFNGVGEYLEDLVARIDAPLLDTLRITFSHQLIFDFPQLTQFITRTPKFKANNEARVEFFKWDVRVTLPQAFDGALIFGISCEQSHRQLSSAAEVCSSSLLQAFIPAVEHLHIQSNWQPRWQDNMGSGSGQWLELFHPFTAVTDLYISSRFTPRIAFALQGLVGIRATEVLPALQTLFLGAPLPSRPVQEAIGQFVATRQLAGHPIAVSRWER
jgi:hypothetical protein